MNAIQLYEYFKIPQWQKARKMPDYRTIKYRFDYETREFLENTALCCTAAIIPVFIFAYINRGDGLTISFFLGIALTCIAVLSFSIKPMFSLVYFLRIAPFKMRVKRYLKQKGLQHFVSTLSQDKYITQNMSEPSYYKNLILLHHSGKDCSEHIYSMLLNYYKYAGQKILEDKEKAIFNEFFNDKVTYMEF